MTKTRGYMALACGLALAFLGLAADPVPGAQTWTIESGFTTTANPSGAWTWGYQKPLGGTLVLYNTSSIHNGLAAWDTDNNGDKRGVVWKNTNSSAYDNGVYVSPGGMVAHPGPNDEKATFRWTAPYAASVYVSAAFWGVVYAGGTTTDVNVLHNGVSLFTAQISGYGGGGGHAWFGSSPYQSYGDTVDVAQGDTIDFCVGCGNGTYYADSTGLSAYISDMPPGPPIPVVNEVQSANSSTIADEDGDHSDWIEVYNAGGSALDLLGYGLSDDPGEPFKWTFPTYYLQPGQYLVVFASDKDRKTGTYLHTNYAIKSSGETISLTAPDGTLVSQTPATSIPQEMSFGRQPDASENLFYFAVPTPGAPNSTQGYTGVLTSPPVFSWARGFYPSAFNLTLSTSVADATIRYTKDGSLPTESSPVYTVPIPIQSGASGEIFKTTPVRARLFRTGYMPSPVATNTYFVGPGSDSRYDLPVISLVTDNANFFDPDIGIYVYGNHNNYSQEGDAWERPIHVEFFEPGGSDGFHCDAGVRIHGCLSVKFPQKSMRLYSDHQGGPGSFNYPIFPESPLTGYERIMLKDWGDDNEYFPDYYPYIPDRYALIRDPLCQALVRDLDLETQLYRPAVVFLNGAYWGLYAIMEREDKHWLQNHHPEIDEDNLDVIQMIDVVDVEEGDAVAWNTLLDYFQSNDLMVPANYEYIRSQMDVDNVLTHDCAQLYVGNTDWPYNNVRFWRERTPGSEWRWTMYDMDFSFGLVVPYTHNILAHESTRGGGQINPDRLCVILASLLRNREAQCDFINRMADMLNTVFEPSAVIAKIDTMAAELSPYVSEHFARWGNRGNATGWTSNLQDLRSFANQRPGAIRDQFVEFFSLSGTSNLTVASSPPNAGSITVNTVNVTPSSMPWQGVYFDDVPVKLTATPAAGYRFVRWSGAGLGTQNPATIVPSGDTAITALFEVNQ